MESKDYVANEDNICVILVYNLGAKIVVAENTIVLGVNFLRKFYTIFDIENNRIGIYGKQIQSKTDMFEGFLFFSLILGFLLATFMLWCYLHYKNQSFFVRRDGSIGKISTAKMHSPAAGMSVKI